MKDARLNPQAIQAASRPPLPTEMFNFTFATNIELNAAAMAEVMAAGELARARGDDERRAIHDVASQWNLKDHAEKFDFVVYNTVQVGRPSVLMPDRVPTANLRVSEHMRIALADLRKRADEAFSNHDAASRPAPH